MNRLTPEQLQARRERKAALRAEADAARAKQQKILEDAKKGPCRFIYELCDTHNCERIICEKVINPNIVNCQLSKEARYQLDLTDRLTSLELQLRRLLEDILPKLLDRIAALERNT